MSRGEAQKLGIDQVSKNLFVLLSYFMPLKRVLIDSLFKNTHKNPLVNFVPHSGSHIHLQL